MASFLDSRESGDGPSLFKYGQWFKLYQREQTKTLRNKKQMTSAQPLTQMLFTHGFIDIFIYDDSYVDYLSQHLGTQLMFRNHFSDVNKSQLSNCQGGNWSRCYEA